MKDINLRQDVPFAQVNLPRISEEIEKLQAVQRNHHHKMKSKKQRPRKSYWRCYYS